MDEEFVPTVNLSKLLHCLDASFHVLARDASLLVIHSFQVANAPKHTEIDGWHEDVHGHSADDALTNVKEPVGIDVLVDALYKDTVTVQRVTTFILVQC